jgi:hypothetical protein
MVFESKMFKKIYEAKGGSKVTGQWRRLDNALNDWYSSPSII